MNDSTLQYQIRINRGRAKELRIMEAMKTQCCFDVFPASDYDDILRGIDCYLRISNKIWPTQIKARQSSEDLLFVIQDDGKPGRDMKTQAELYAFLIHEQLYLIKTIDVRKVIRDLVDLMITSRSRFRTLYRGVECEISEQIDPVKKSVKLMAFIPAILFTDVIDPIQTPSKINI